MRVSIHAPTKGATRVVVGWVGVEEVSIHAPTKGATRDGWRSPRCSAFQSTRPRRARQPPPRLPQDLDRFNPRAHEGRDDKVPGDGPQPSRFNPRAHEGRDCYATFQHASIA